MSPTQGSYVLLLALEERCRIAIGALGDAAFEPGVYAYAGSAWGPGGFSRLERHRSVAEGESNTRHWHIDYLLSHPQVELEAALRFPKQDIECRLAQEIGNSVVPGFGASDCGCDSHLSLVGDSTAVEQAARIVAATLETEAHS